MTLEKFSYMNRSNLEYIEQLFQQFQTNPENVDPEWRMFFEGMEFAQKSASQGEGFSQKEMDVWNLIKAYRDYGHLKANLDPLGLAKPNKAFFDLARFNLSEKDLDRSFHIGSVVGLPKAKLRDIIAHLEASYCQTVTAQLAECREEVRDWFRNEFESSQPTYQLSKDDKKEILFQLMRTEALEKFIHTRYVGTKRFSIEGGDALIPMLETLVKRGQELSPLEEVVIGMAHRGRINVLANYMGKALKTIFAEFDGTVQNNGDYDGDVKYHHGYSADKQTPAGTCHISLAFNPSHLEAVDPVVCGMARAKQRQRNDTKERRKVIPVQIHGDAAFAGQGVVSETLQMSQLDGYRVGGSIHVIINNQVGFTTNPEHGRSSLYSSDVSKAIKAPVLLVNGDDVEACVRAMDMALRFRQQFNEDVVIDMICYRRFGHNEGDEPSFTQPVMYTKIKKHPTLLTIYKDQVAKENVLSKEEADKFYKEKIDNLQQILDETRANPPQVQPLAYGGLWSGLRRGNLADFDQSIETGVDKEVLQLIGKTLTTTPEGFQAHRKIEKLLGNRAKMMEQEKLDWAMGELLCYGSLCLENTSVRISGQDAKRGTFTHRQAVLFDSNNATEYSPLAHLSDQQGRFCIYNSPLSEMAVLGFEYGNAISDPTFLTIWEAQFGDFANGAQIIIDQFLASGEEKWARSCGLTLLLPHGYEGQGPEHSSARLERFLQLCAQANMQVCNLTTPANLFHALRRQVKRDFRKPLVIMSPKSLLRHPKAVSSLDEFTRGHFQEVLDDPFVKDPKKVEKLILCSGKLYYDLDKAREEGYKEAAESVAVIRMEQLYPFPRVQLSSFINGYPKLKRVVWAQEEPQNMGAYFRTAPKIKELLSELGLKKMDVEYVGRTERASPATGSPKTHEKEQQAIVSACFEG